jgi:hypothetical protein
MSLNVSDFIGQFKYAGARANLFEVTGQIPSAAGSFDGTKASFLIKAASFPSSIIAPIEINFRGRKVQYAGDRSFEPWTITVLNDVDFYIRNKFEAWSNIINNYGSNLAFREEFNNYTVDWTISQLDRKNQKTKTYKLKNCWPTNIAAIDVGNDNENTIEEFTVELQFLDFIPSDVDGVAGGITTFVG